MSSRSNLSSRIVLLALALGLGRGCGSSVQGSPPLHAVLYPPRGSDTAPRVVASASAAPVQVSVDAGRQDEASKDESDLPDEPEDGQGHLLDVGVHAGDCRLRVVPADPSLPAFVQEWIAAKEKDAAHEAAALCSLGRATGPLAAGFACRGRLRRANTLIVACYTFPNVMGNANPSRAHAVFDVTFGRAKRLGVEDMFLDRRRTCRVVGDALAARGAQLHVRTATEWSSRCLASSSGPVSDDSVSIVGSAITFDLPYDFFAWGNAPDPLIVPVAKLDGALTPRFAALLAEPVESRTLPSR